MPLLMCPNCNGSMQEVKRGDVALDMCPACRGVWLDRGELEKLLAGIKEERAETQAFAQDREQFYKDPEAYRRSHPQPPPQSPYGYGERGEQGERGERGHDPRYGYKKKRGFDIFDVFD